MTWPLVSRTKYNRTQEELTHLVQLAMTRRRQLDQANEAYAAIAERCRVLGEENVRIAQTLAKLDTTLGSVLMNAQADLTMYLAAEQLGDVVSLVNELKDMESLHWFFKVEEPIAPTTEGATCQATT